MCQIFCRKSCQNDRKTRRRDVLSIRTIRESLFPTYFSSLIPRGWFASSAAWYFEKSDTSPKNLTKPEKSDICVRFFLEFANSRVGSRREKYISGILSESSLFDISGKFAICVSIYFARMVFGIQMNPTLKYKSPFIVLGVSGDGERWYSFSLPSALPIIICHGAWKREYQKKNSISAFMNGSEGSRVTQWTEPAFGSRQG